jgi:hypothetical protein
MAETTLRAFKQDGIWKFQRILDELLEDPEMEISLDWILDDSISKEISSDIVLQDIRLDTKLNAAQTLLPVLRQVNLVDKYYNPGLWSWLSAFYFDSVCPPDTNGLRKPGKSYRHIPPANRNWRTVYRHLLAGPVSLYGLHESDIKIIFHSRLHEMGDFVEQLASRQDLSASTGVLMAADLLYWDPEAGKPKLGARATTHEPGTLRRFVIVLRQLMLTYDLFSLDAEAILGLLPYKEFEVWMPEDLAEELKPSG